MNLAKKKYKGGICVIFSDRSVPQITKSMSESQFPKLTNSIVDIWSVVLGLQTARDNGYQMVEIRTPSRLLGEVLTKWLDVWKKNKWKRGNGGRLVIPITLLKRLDSLLMEVNVNVVHIARGSGPEIVLAETLGKPSNCKRIFLLMSLILFYMGCLTYFRFWSQEISI